MKILFCAPQPFFKVRGTPINVRNIVKALGEAGHSVDLLCYGYGEDLDLKNVRILRTPALPGVRDVKVGPSLAKLPLDAMMFLRAFALALFNKYDVIHAVEESAFFAILLKKIFHTRFIYDMDSVISEQLRYTGFTSVRPIIWLAERCEAAAIRASDFVLTVCGSLSDKVREVSPDTRIVQIEDAPLQSSYQSDADGARRLRRELELADRPVIVYTGNLESYQGIDLLLRAMAAACKSDPELCLVIVGGERGQIERLQGLAANLNIAENCRFAGCRPVAEMPAYMTMADILVSPRIKGSNTALKIYTYMQSGKPIVATRLPTHCQVLDEDCAYLVPPQIDDLAQGLLRALREPEQSAKLAVEAQRRVSEKYSLPHFNSRVRQAYSSLQEND
jgi:glycosyltransferase involved in cell wall biosynthesis